MGALHRHGVTMNRTRLFSPHIYESADGLLWREHNTRQKRLTVILLAVLAVGVALLVHQLTN